MLARLVAHRLGILVTLVVIAGVLAPAGAGASTARVHNDRAVDEACRYSPSVCEYGVLIYAAAPGEQNTVAVQSVAGAPSVAIVRDPNAEIEPGPGCTSRGPHEVECRSEPGILTALDVAAGDLDDSVANLGSFLSARLHGGEGDDELSGGASSDWLDGGRGSDSMDGNGGDDTVDYTARSADLFVDLASAAPVARIANERDSLREIERVRGGRGPDVLRGSSGVDFLYGGGGGDRVSGGAGGDLIFGGRGADRLHGNDGRDLVDGGPAADVLRGGCGEDQVDGASGHDRIYALDGAPDEIYGEGGIDFAEVDRRLDELLRVERVRRRAGGTCPG